MASGFRLWGYRVIVEECTIARHSMGGKAIGQANILVQIYHP